jgi:CTD kinase subunit beta
LDNVDSIMQRHHADNFNQNAASPPPSCSKYHHPYFTPAEVDYLSDKQRGKLAVSQEQKLRQYACGELEVIGARLGL